MREESGVNRGSFVNHPAVGLRCAREYSNALIALQKKFSKATKELKTSCMAIYKPAIDQLILDMKWHKVLLSNSIHIVVSYSLLSVSNHIIM